MKSTKNVWKKCVFFIFCLLLKAGLHAKAGRLPEKLVLTLKNYFNQWMACRAHVSWSKYTTNIPRIEFWSFYQTLISLYFWTPFGNMFGSVTLSSHFWTVKVFKNGLVRCTFFCKQRTWQVIKICKKTQKLWILFVTLVFGPPINITTAWLGLYLLDGN